FRECMANAIQRFKPTLIAEEFSAHALEKLRTDTGAEHESVTRAAAESLGIEHRFCDPNDEERAKMRYVEGSQLALQIALNNNEGLSNAEVNNRGFAIEIAKYWPLREQFWLDRLSDIKNRDLLFV